MKHKRHCRTSDNRRKPRLSCLICLKPVGSVKTIRNDEVSVEKRELLVAYFWRKLVVTPLSDDDFEGYLTQCGNPSEWTPMCQVCKDRVREALKLHLEVCRKLKEIEEIRKKLLEESYCASDDEDGDADKIEAGTWRGLSVGGGTEETNGFASLRQRLAQDYRKYRRGPDMFEKSLIVGYNVLPRYVIRIEKKKDDNEEEDDKLVEGSDYESDNPSDFGPLPFEEADLDDPLQEESPTAADETSSANVHSSLSQPDGDTNERSLVEEEREDGTSQLIGDRNPIELIDIADYDPLQPVTTEETPSKRTREVNKDNWLANVNRRKRMQGEPYVPVHPKLRFGADGKVIVRPGRELGPPCMSAVCSKSKFRHCMSFSQDLRREIFNKMWQKFDWPKKRAFVLEHVDRVKCKPHSSGEESKRGRFLYFLKKDGERLQVCNRMFVNTIGINERRVRAWMLGPELFTKPRKPRKVKEMA